MRLGASRSLHRRGSALTWSRKPRRQANPSTLGQSHSALLGCREKELRDKTYTEISRYLEKTWKPLHDAPSTTLAAGIWSKVDMDRRQMVLAEVRTKNAQAHGRWRRRMSSKQKNEIPPDLLDERMLSQLQ